MSPCVSVGNICPDVASMPGTLEIQGQPTGVLFGRSQIMLTRIGDIYQGLEIDSAVPRMPGFRL